jgi:dTDP-4-amino-4,6-dideoxygalactose transaminase
MPPIPRDPFRELPPTAGLPIGWRDLRAGFAAQEGDFSRAAARFLGVDELLLTCSGTAALVIALTTLARLSNRREVIVPAYTCPLVAIAVAYCGLRLVTCDLAPVGIGMDLGLLAGLIGLRTLAVVPTHLAGRVVPVEPVRRLATRHGAFVVEDAAQALGALQDGQPVGTRGDIGFYSLAVGKGLTLYEGGLLHASDPILRAELAHTAANILRPAPLMELRRSLELAAYGLFYRPRLLPWAYGAAVRRYLRRGDKVAAAGDHFDLDIPLHRVGRWRQRIGESALARLPDFLARGRERAERLRECLGTVPGLMVIEDGPGATGTWPALMVQLSDRQRRDQALDALWGAGLGVSCLFTQALTDYPYLSPVVPYVAHPRARHFAATSLLIGNSPWLENADMDRIAATLASGFMPEHTQQKACVTGKNLRSRPNRQPSRQDRLTRWLA